MRSVKAALVVHPEWLVIPEEQQAAWQIRVIQVDRAEERDRTKDCQDSIVRRKDTKTTSYIETTQVDSTVAVILLQQQSANKKTADDEKDVNADVAMG
jgi:hypothetical protein